MQDYKHVHSNSQKREEEAKSGRKISLFFWFLLLLNLIAFFYSFSDPNSMLKKELKAECALFIILLISINALYSLTTYLANRYKPRQ